jgi:chromosome segregation ATPase
VTAVTALRDELEKIKVDKQKQADKQAELEKSTQSAAAEAAKQKNNLAAIQKQKEAAEKELTAMKQTNDAVDAQLKDTQRRLQEVAARADASEKQRAAALEKSAKSVSDVQGQMQKELNGARAEIDGFKTEIAVIMESMLFSSDDIEAGRHKPPFLMQELIELPTASCVTVCAGKVSRCIAVAGLVTQATADSRELWN